MPSDPTPRTRWLFAVTSVAAIAVALLPTGHIDIIGGHARPIVLPADTSSESGTYLLATATLRHRTVAQTIWHRLSLGIHQSRAASNHGTSMADAKAHAWNAARAIVGPSLTVVQVRSPSPAARAGLEIGDIVTDISGHAPTVGAIDRGLSFGDTVRLRVLRGGIAHDVELRPTPPYPQPLGGGATYAPTSGPVAAPPLDTGGIEGDSAGLLLALAYVDLLTPGDLTGGAKVAATGTVNDAGALTGVLGYSAKADAVARQGAALFLVPADDIDAATTRAPQNLRIVGVHSVVHAVFELCGVGGVSSVCSNYPN
ncbi:MAG: PDZ domain-containing protein [Acidimicrobiia bacterium]